MLHTTRRKFAFYLGLGLFSLSQKLRASVLDDVAAATMELAEHGSQSATRPVARPSIASESFEHWTYAENDAWRWYERENFVDGAWRSTGITTPINRLTGEVYRGQTGYLDERLLPEKLRFGGSAGADEFEYASDGDKEGEPAEERRARHGRPPSKWLRSLYADELRIWLKKITVPEAGVSGMTFWTHLTRDHSFDAERIDGRTEDEQAKLHAAAHYGY